jgi:hypothetical protein
MLQPLIKPMDLIKETWHAFTKTWETTVRISGWYVAISAGTAISLFLNAGSGGSQFLGFILQILTFIGSIYISVKLYQTIFSLEEGKPVTPDQQTRTWKSIGQIMLTILMIIIPIIIFFAVIVVLLRFLPKSLLIPTIIPVFLAIVVGTMYVCTRLTFVQTRIVDKSLGAIEAIKYSWMITKQKFWAIFYRMFLGGFIFGALMIGLIIAGTIIVSLVSGVDLSSAMTDKDPSTAVSSITELIQGIILAGLLPLFSTFSVKLFRAIEKAATPSNPVV